MTGENVLGIVFAGGEGPPPGALKRLFAGEAKGALTVAADSGLELAEAAGLRPDWIVGDMDSLSNAARLQDYPPERVMRHPADKDFTDTELALSLLWENGCSRVWIAGGFGGRVDHLFGIRSLFERSPFPCRWLGPSGDIYCIEGETLHLAVPAETLVSVFPLRGGSGSVWQASSCGLKWQLDAAAWGDGAFGISNRALAGEFSVTAARGRFMIIVNSI